MLRAKYANAKRCNNCTFLCAIRPTVLYTQFIPLFHSLHTNIMIHSCKHFFSSNKVLKIKSIPNSIIFELWGSRFLPKRVTHFMKYDLYYIPTECAHTRTEASKQANTHDEHSIVPFPNMEVTFCSNNQCNGYYKLKCHGWTVLLSWLTLRAKYFIRKQQNNTKETKWNEINNKIL